VLERSGTANNIRQIKLPQVTMTAAAENTERIEKAAFAVPVVNYQFSVERF
jgi:hypothetical protein